MLRHRHSSRLLLATLLCLLLTILTFTARADSLTPATDTSGLREAQTGQYNLTREPVSPAWVEDINSLPTGSKNAPLVIRLVDMQYLVAAKPARYLHAAYQINENATLDSIGKYPIVFQPDYQQLHLHRLRIHRDGQVLDKLSSATVRFMQSENQAEQGMLTGEVTALVITDDLRVGDTLEVAYSIDGDNPVFGGKFFDSATWERELPVSRRRITIYSPLNRPIHYKTIGGDASSPPIKPSTSRRGEQQVIRFESTNLPANESSSDSTPPDVYPLRWLQFSEFDNWRQVVDWGQGLFQAEADGPALNAALDRVGKTGSTEERVRRALSLVQNDIRYLSLSIGENSHRPNPPQLVLSRRYGDCKDKTLLFVTLLRRMGISADPVLLSTQMRKGLKQLLPSPALFDHVIARVQIDGKTYYLDPTLQGQVSPLDKLGQPYPDYDGLVLATATQGLSQLPPPSDRALLLQSRDEQLTVKKFGESSDMQVTLTYAGLMAEEYRRSAPLASSEQWRKFYASALEDRYPGTVLVSGPVISDDSRNNAVKLTLNYRLPKDAFKLTDGRWYIPYRASNFTNLFLKPANPSDPRTIWVPRYPDQYTYRFRINLPEKQSAAPAEHNTLGNSAWTVDEQVSFDGNQAEIALDLRFKRDRVMSPDAAEYLANVRDFDKFSGGSLYFSTERGNTATAQPEVPKTRAERLQAIVEQTSRNLKDSSLNGSDRDDALCERALAQAYLGRKNEALTDANAALKRQPDSAGMLFCRGQVRYLLDDIDSGGKDFSRAIALSDQDADLRYRRGIIRFLQGNDAEAATDFARARDIGADQESRARVSWR